MGYSFQLKEVEKQFSGDGIITPVLHKLDLTIQKGEFTSIVGPSGSGKSTLLSLIGTLDQPTSGQILYGEQDVTKMNAKQLANFRFEEIGFIFQQFYLLPSLTALENVMAPVFVRNVSFHKKERAEHLLKQLGLHDKLHSLPSQLSGGQQQRVAIARALINEPSWILADEPTGNLDTENGKLVFEYIQALNQQKACSVLFVTHDLGLAEKADRIVEMKDGYIVSDTRGEQRCSV